MSTDNVVGLEGVDKQDTDAYTKNYGAFVAGQGFDKVMNYYDNWAQDGTYEEVLRPGRYNGPEAAARVVERYYGDKKDDTYIIDVAAGTGFVGEQLKMRGFTKVDALEPSEEMLSLAAAKNIYRRTILDSISRHKTCIEDDTYDALVMSGGMGEGHIPTAALVELIRVVKPGGCVCIVMREEYINYVAEYIGRLEPFMQQLVDQGAWTWEERTVVPDYAFDKPGVAFVFRVKESGAPTITSTQFTK
ncbi:hypothetical protein LSAT2_013729 [Lamellibrachia satsuma]|nr:hypothetical protein LSAT2_013729 [Lamellibrachia satsuma]